MPTWQVVLLYIGWLLASAAIGIVSAGFAVIVVEALTGNGDLGPVFDVVVVVVFVVLAALPFLLRSRTGEGRRNGG